MIQDAQCKNKGGDDDPKYMNEAGLRSTYEGTEGPRNDRYFRG